MEHEIRNVALTRWKYEVLSTPRNKVNNLRNGKTLLIHGICSQSLGACSYIEEILQLVPEIDVNRPCAQKFPPILYAVCKGKIDIVTLLLKRKVKLDNLQLPEPLLVSALQLAAKAYADYPAYNYYAQLEREKIKTCVELLIENGCPVEESALNGQTPLQIAAKSARSYWVCLLLKEGAYPDLGPDQDLYYSLIIQETVAAAKCNLDNKNTALLKFWREDLRIKPK